MNNKKIAIIGCGNLGTALCLGLINSGEVEPQNLYLTRRNIDSLKLIKNKHDVNISTNNSEFVKEADVVIFAVKPYMLFTILDEVKEHLNNSKIIVSLAAGISSNQIFKFLNSSLSVFYVIPNTAISVNQSMTCINFENSNDSQVEQIVSLFKLVGEVECLQPEQMLAATVVASCNTAYAMRFIRANTVAGIEIGLKSDLAKRLSAQTLKGAAEIILSANSSPEDEIDKVCTPAGTTIVGLNELEKYGFSNSIIRCFKAAYKKISGV